MDAFGIISGIIMVILIAMLIVLLYGLFMVLLKDCAASRKGYLWTYRGRIYKMDEPDWSKSKYLNKYRPRIDKYLGCYATTDDEVIIEVAMNLSEMIDTSDVYKRTEFLLAFVQQNVKYTSDTQYNVSDHWVFPVNTLRMHKGDCEDSAFLFAALACHMGIAPCIALVPGHCTTGVLNGKKGATFEHKYSPHFDPVKYYVTESTSSLPIIGMYKGSLDVYASSTPMNPTEEFLKGMKDIKYFE